MANANRSIKAGRWTYTSHELDQMCDAAERRGKAELRSKPLASRVQYDESTGHVIIELNNGCTLPSARDCCRACLTPRSAT